MSRIVVIAVLVLAALAAADAFRAKAHEQTTSAAPAAQSPVVVHRVPSSGLVAVGAYTRKRVLLDGREYLSEAQVDAAYPAPLQGMPFDIAYVARAPDGTVVLAVYKFPELSPAQAGIELWRKSRLVSAFSVRPGSFAGGVGFADDGRLVATLSSDGLVVSLYTRDGRHAGHQSATSW